MTRTGATALNTLLQEMQALMGILPVAMLPLAPRLSSHLAPSEPGRAAQGMTAAEEARIEAGFDNLPV